MSNIELITQNNLQNHWYFTCDSDIHVGWENKLDINDKPIMRKFNSVGIIKKYHDDFHLDFSLCVGDMTHHGSDKKSRDLCDCYTCPSNGNEMSAFLEKYHHPLENYGIPLKLCIGNHDVNRCWYPDNSMLNFIKLKHNSTYSWFYPKQSSCYFFDHKGFRFICLGLYPHNIKWLLSVLPEDVKKPLIFYYHYNTQPHEYMSNWWSDKEKNNFFDIIKNYNVKLIINGHNHITKYEKWNDIPNILCGGDPPLIEVNGENLTIKFI